MHLRLNVRLGRRQRGCPDVHQVILQFPLIVLAQDCLLHKVYRPAVVTSRDGVDRLGLARLGLREIVE